MSVVVQGLGQKKCQSIISFGHWWMTNVDTGRQKLSGVHCKWQQNSLCIFYYFFAIYLFSSVPKNSWYIQPFFAFEILSEYYKAPQNDPFYPWPSLPLITLVLYIALQKQGLSCYHWTLLYMVNCTKIKKCSMCWSKPRLSPSLNNCANLLSKL